MARAVLISIRPEWVNRIISGEKTVEIRKNRPNLKAPFKVYIYCTDGVGKNTVNIPITKEQLQRHYAETGSMECLNCHIGNQKVIGEFVCDEILEIDKRGLVEQNFDYCYASLREWGNDDIAIYIKAVHKSCVPREQLNQYGESVHFLYLWKISRLQIYETPKELSVFNGLRKTRFGSDPIPIKHPPQSWRYVEDLEMADYISREALLALPTETKYDWTDCIDIEDIRNFPTADVEPVRHGRWISWEDADNCIPSPHRHECSVCHDAAQVLVNGLELLSDYCPNCGAKMDLEDEK